MTIAASHKLDLSYDSPCANLHGHNWVIEVTVASDNLNLSGMVVDFAALKDFVFRLDHIYLNKVFDKTNPTAENIAVWIFSRLQTIIEGASNKPKVTKVTVQESEGNIACYIP